MAEIAVAHIENILVIVARSSPSHGILYIPVARRTRQPAVSGTRLNAVYFLRPQRGVTPLKKVAVVVLHEIAQRAVVGTVGLDAVIHLQSPFSLVPARRKVGKKILIVPAWFSLPHSKGIIVRFHVLIAQSGIQRN